MILVLIILFAFLLRLYQLDSLPAEMWGDVIEHYKLADGIGDGYLFLDYRFGGDGPLFSYLVFFVSRFLGLSFYSIKFTTAFIGTILVLIVYFVAKELFGRKEVGYISSFLAAVSFWSLSFSRQAKPHILVPLFVCLTLLFLLKKKKLLSGMFLGLGMYSQAGFWGVTLFAFFNL